MLALNVHSTFILRALARPWVVSFIVYCQIIILSLGLLMSLYF